MQCSMEEHPARFSVLYSGFIALKAKEGWDADSFVGNSARHFIVGIMILLVQRETKNDVDALYGSIDALDEGDSPTMAQAVKLAL